jgi:hypothetical protein
MTKTDELEAEVASLTAMLHHLETVPGSWPDWNPAQPCKPQDRQDGAIFDCRRALEGARDKLQKRLQADVEFLADFRAALGNLRGPYRMRTRRTG